MRGGIIAAGCLTLLAALSATGAATPGTDDRTVTFVNTKGEQIGTATLTQTPNGVLVSVDVSGLPPGEHGLHFHETGRCDPQTGFKSAGGHYAPRKHEHGFQVEAGPHAGDMPNQFVGRDGRLRAHLFNPNVSLAERAAPLLDSDGSAIIIHAGADDYRSQPSGNAGDRLACAEIS